MSNSEESRKTAPVYLFWDGEFLLDSTVEKAWPHVLDYPAWQNFPLVQHVSGRPGEEGEVVRLRKEEGGFSSPPYYARTIKLEPNHRVIWKVYLEPGQVDFDMSGFVEFTVAPGEERQKTRFGYHLLYEFLVPYKVDAELENFHRQTQESLAGVFASMWPKLKDLVAGRS
jgi:hypothetical protein